jgi:hypothetical protein
MAHSKLYVQLMNSREWRELREAKLRANPLCECCQAQGYVVAARCVHHIVEVESGRTEQECRDLCFQWTNLQALCYPCHKQIHESQRTWKAEHHQQVAQNRLQRWIDKHTKK